MKSIKILLTLALILCLKLSVFSQANFTYTTSTGTFCAGVSVTFTQQAASPPIEYLWDFGNGQTGSGTSFTINYPTPGTYSVMMTAVYQTFASTSVKQITIYPNPTVTITPSKPAICKPEPITFTANPSGPAVTNYNWTFGDGNTASTTINQATNNYSAFQGYSPSVQVVTANGCTALATTSVNLSPVGISGQISPDKGCIPMNTNLNINVALLPGDGLQNVVWDFGDGSPTASNSASSIAHTYNITTPITTAGVAVTTTNGCTNNYTFPRAAFGTPPPAIAANTVALRDTFCASETVAFTANALLANEYQWDFGDGQTATTLTGSASHRYASLGTKTVKVTSYFNGCMGAFTTFNVVIVGVIANFSESNTCANKNTISFSNSSLGTPTSYSWTFSDVPASPVTTVYSPTHTFPTVGDFTTTLNLVDATTGCTDSKTTNQYFRFPQGNVLKRVVCRDSANRYWVTNPYPVAAGYNYEYHVGGTVISGANMDTLNTNLGTHGIFTEYIVITKNNPGLCSDTLLLPGTVKVQGPIADFTITDTTCFNEPTFITNISSNYFPSDNIVLNIWYYGHGNPDTIQTPRPHYFANPGQQSVTLYVRDQNGCGNKKTLSTYVYPIPTIYAYPVSDTLCQGASLDLQAYSLETITWTPNTGGICTSCDSTTVMPMTSTDYVAHVSNSFGCSNTDTVKIKVYEPFNLAFNPPLAAVCPGTPVQVTASPAQLIYNWTPAGSISNPNIANPVITVWYGDSTTLFQLAAKDSGNCYTDTATFALTTFVAPYVEAGNDTIIGYNQPFTLNPVYGSTVAQYAWAPGTGLSCTTCPRPSGAVQQSTLYTIVVTTREGCKDTSDIRVIVDCDKNLLMPEAFSPNGDGKNDYFYPIGFGVKEIKTLLIYDRRGFKVFERKNFAPNQPLLGWDGSYKNYNPFNTQAFVYFLEAECDKGGLIQRKGSVILIR